jgi:hypothetical protein
MNEKYIKFNKQTLSVKIISRKGPLDKTLKAAPWNGDLVSHPLSRIVYFDILYPAIQARDKRQGIKRSYSLIHPDPWLVGIAMVMWEGIVQGMAWDAIKIFVKKAYEVMAANGIAPSGEPTSRAKKSKTELGFVWTQYKDGRKQYQMFLGLRRVYSKNIKNNGDRSVKRLINKDA